MQRGNAWVKYFWLAMVLYMIFSVGRLAYKNYQLNMEEATLKQDVASLENDILELRNQIVYFQSDSYKDKMIRAKLNMQKEGEKVVVIPPTPEVAQASDKTAEKLNNPQKWLRYFFGI
jgi:cell division protein FtsB